MILKVSTATESWNCLGWARLP